MIGDRRLYLNRGSIAADTAGYAFLNVSIPLPGEIYIDFGFTGMVVGGILVGWGIATLDRRIDRLWSLDLRSRLIAGAMVGYTLPVYRGSLLGVIAPFATIAVAFWIIGKLGMQPPRPAPGRRPGPAPSPIPRPLAIGS